VITGYLKLKKLLKLKKKVTPGLAKWN